MKFAKRLKRIPLYILFILYVGLFYLVKPFAFISRKLSKEKIYLFTERGNDCQDNAYFLYKYAKKQGRKCKFIISSKTVDSQKIDKCDLINYNSFKSIFYINKAEYIISTHIDWWIPFPTLSQIKIHFFKVHAKIVFLQHGIIMNNNSLDYFNKFIDLFVSGSLREYDFLTSFYHYPNGVIQLTGLPRYDYLLDHILNEPLKEIHNILILPTWRTYVNEYNFKDSEYFKKWTSLISNADLLNYCRKNNIKITCCLHHVLVASTNELKKYENDVVFIGKRADKENIHDLIISHDLLITDFSSVNFDFGYQKKPMIFYQFDEERFFKEHCKPGYFNYHTDGFGPSVNTEEEVINFIKNKEFDVSKYENNYKKTFKYQDKNNCQRVFEAIEKL